MENGLNQHYSTLLGLGEEWRVTNVDLNVLGRRIDIYLEYTKDCAPCPECGTLCSVYGQQPERVWRHLDTMQFETLIHAKTPRVRCERHKVRVVELPWATKSSHFTLLFEAFAVAVLQAARSVKDAQGLLRLSWWQTHEIMKAAVERGLARREAEEISFVGLDDVSCGVTRPRMGERRTDGVTFDWLAFRQSRKSHPLGAASRRGAPSRRTWRVRRRGSR